MTTPTREQLEAVRDPARHSFTSYSWRGSWPTFRCVRCGCDSRSVEATQPCVPTGTEPPQPAEGA